jgi:hypothetical protein
MKPVLKRWLLGLSGLFILFISAFAISLGDAYGMTPFFLFPSTTDGRIQQVFWYFMILIMSTLGVVVGMLIASLVVRSYVKSSKIQSSIQLLGFAKYNENTKVLISHFISRIVFGVLFCVNIWVMLFDYNVFELWVKPEYLSQMYQGETMLNFPMVPWYWVPTTLVAILFSIAFVILDSGLVMVKKVPEHPDFSDTERVGNLFWNIVKGYAGISGILSFIQLILTPLGREGSLVSYPFMALVGVFYVITTIDLLKTWGCKRIFEAVKKEIPPEIIGLDYKRTPINDSKQLFE